MTTPKLLIASGRRMHLIRQSDNGIVAVSPAAAASYEGANLANGNPGVPSRFGNTTATEFYWTADLNLVKNGGFETWLSATSVADWTLEGTTIIAQETSNPIAGSSSLRLAGQAYQDVQVPTGALCGLGVKMCAETGPDSFLQLIDLETGEFLTSDAAWTTTTTDLWTEGDTGLNNARTKGILFTARPYSTVKRDLTTLRIRLIGGTEGASQEGFFDDVVLLVMPNFASLHGHNIPHRKLPHSIRSGHTSAMANAGTLGTAQLVPSQPVFETRDARASSTPNQPSAYYRFLDNCPRFTSAGTLELVAGVSSRADSKLFTLSMWVRRNGDDEEVASRRLIRAVKNGNDRLLVTLRPDKGIQVELSDVGNAQRVTLVSNAESVPPDLNWHHVLVSVDTTTGVERSQIYIDGADAKNTGASSLVADAVIDWSGTDDMIYGGLQGAGEARCAINELYIQTAFSEDLSVAGNREKFRSSSGDRVDLGADGSTPSGAQAWFYHYGTQAEPLGFAKNHGDGGGPFTVVGTVETECMFASQRFWQLRMYQPFSMASFQDDPAEKIEVGEWVLSRVEELPRQRIVPHSAPRSRPARELRTATAGILRAPMSYADARRFSLTFEHKDLTEHEAWLELMRERTGGGAYPVVVVPDTDAPDAHFGFVSLVAEEEEMELYNQFRVRVTFEELPFAER